MKSVDAVKTIEEVAEVATLLKHYSGQLYEDMWNIGVNMTLRISDLLAIKYENVDIENRCYLLIEQKTENTRKVKKIKEVRLNQKVITIIERRRREFPDDIYLFQVHSNRSKNKPPSRSHVARLFNDVGHRMKINLGTHSMRKTRGYFMYKNGVSLEMICKVLGHNSPATTLAYIGIERENILETYDDFVL